MSWITPVTDRTSNNDKMTYTDMNRITGNIQYLNSQFVSYGRRSANTIKTNWVQNWIIGKDEWQAVVDEINACKTAMGLSDSSATTEFSYSNINLIETISLEIYNFISVLGNQRKVYSGEVYAGEEHA